MKQVVRCPQCGGILPYEGTPCQKCSLAAALEAETVVGTSGILDLGAGRLVGDYELLDIIGRGGMGVVWKARQRSLKRLVAVKQLLGHGPTNEQARRRFQLEAESAARLQHASIVSIYQVGNDHGQPFFAMELVLGKDGEPAPSLAHLAREGPLPPERAAEYVRLVAQALHYAHQRGIVHRDVKPSNILVDAADRPRLGDFGLARPLDDEARLTLSGRTLGTPAYMPPEQIDTRHQVVGPWSDVYGLGALFYHLLTGRAPFNGANELEILDRVRRLEPMAPRRVIPTLPIDLETICLRCLEKEPKARYQTAEEVADEIARWQRGQPIRARPISYRERFWKLCRRNKRLSAVMAVAAILVMAATGISVWQWFRGEERRRGWSEATLKEVIKSAEGHLSDGKAAQALGLLADRLIAEPSNRVLQERLVNLLNQRSFLMPVTPPQVPLPELDGDVQVRRLACRTPDKRLLATVADKNGLQLLELPSSNRVWSVANAHRKVIRSLSLSPDGQWLASASADQLVRIWQVPSPQPVRELPHPAAVYHATFSPVAPQLATACLDKVARVWSLKAEAENPKDFLHPGGVYSARFSPDGRLLVTTSDDGLVRLWDLQTGQMAAEPLVCSSPPEDAEFVVGGATLCVTLQGNQKLFVVRTAPDRLASEEELAQVLDRAPPGPQGSTNLLLELGIHASITNEFSPNREFLAVAHERGVGLRRWRDPRGSVIRLDHSARVNGVRFSPDNLRLATSTIEGKVRLWDAATGVPLTDWMVTDGTLLGVEFSVDGKWLIPDVPGDEPAPWRIHQATGDAPRWLSELARRIAGHAAATDGISASLISGPEETARSSHLEQWVQRLCTAE